MPRKKKTPDTGDTKPKALIIDRRNPLQAFAPEQRAYLAEVAKVKRDRKNLPPMWQQLVVAVISSGPYSDATLAAALQVSLRTFQRWKTDVPELAEVIARADAHLQTRLLSPIMQRALAGDPNCGMWMAARLWPTQFGEKPSAVNVQVNTQAPAPSAPPFTPADFLALVDAARAQAAAPIPLQALPVKP